MTVLGDRISWAPFYLDPASHEAETMIRATGLGAAPTEQLFVLLADLADAAISTRPEQFATPRRPTH